MNDELLINEDGRFQLPAEELPAFAAYLRENHVPCDTDEARTFLADGHPYSFGTLRHLYDLETAQDLYRTWCRAAKSV